MERAAVLDPDTDMVVNVISATDINIIPNLVPADGEGNIGDWYNRLTRDFIPPYDPRHPNYVAPPAPKAG